MATQHAADEADIRARIDRWAAAIGRMDISRVMSIYTPDVVSFDLAGALQCVGAEAKKKPWRDVFSMYLSPIDYEVRDLSLTLGETVAFGHSFNRISGTRHNGEKTSVWVRWTPCFRKIDGNWLIAHEQVSVPIDPASGTALRNLEP